MEHGCWLFYIKLVRFQCLKMNVRREKPAALLRSNRIRPEVTHVQTDGDWAARPPQTTDLVWKFWVIQVKPCLKTRFSRLLANCRPFLIIEYFNLAWNVILSHYGDSKQADVKLTSVCCSDSLRPTLGPAACCSLTSGAQRLYARLLSDLKLLVTEKQNFKKWERRSESLGGGFEVGGLLLLLI